MKLTKTQLREIIREEIQSLKETNTLFGMKPTIVMKDKNGMGRYEYTAGNFTLDILYDINNPKFPYALAIYDKNGFVSGYSMKPFKSKEAMEMDIKRILPKLKSAKQTPFKL
jgi:hypothetical protein